MKLNASVVWLAIALAPPAFAGQAEPSPPSATVALVTTYAEGRVHYDLVSRRVSSSWTAAFPRIASWKPSPDAAPISALKTTRQVVGDAVQVKISLLIRGGMGDELPIAAVTLAKSTRVRVSELASYGVTPIELSLVDVLPTTPFPPAVVSVSPDIEISGVDLLSVPYPGYRVRLRNLSPNTVATFHVQSYRGSEKAISTVRAGVHGLPGMTPGGEYAFDMNLTGGSPIGDGPWSPTPLDLIEIDAVMWADGTSTGALPVGGAMAHIPTDAGTRLMLERAVEILRRANEESADPNALLETLRQRYEAIAIESSRLETTPSAMRSARSMLLADLVHFQRDRSGPTDVERVRVWIADTTRRYESWIKRLSPV